MMIKLRGGFGLDGWGGMYDFGLDRRRTMMITRGFGRMDG